MIFNNSAMSKSKSRLKVFRDITEDSQYEYVSRILEISEISHLPLLLQKICSFGTINISDCSTFPLGFIRVSFYDIRDATSLVELLDSQYSVKFIKNIGEPDYVSVGQEDYFSLMPLLRNCGEISQVNRIENCFVVHFYDVRATRAAVCLINRLAEIKATGMKLGKVGF